MTTSQVESDGFTTLEKQYYEEQVVHLCTPAVNEFKRIIKSFTIFNLAFLLLFIVESLTILVFFAFLAKTSILAFSLAILFLTIFSYFVLRMYLNAKKPGELIELKNDFILACKKLLNFQEGVAEHHLALAQGATKFALILKDLEYHFYTPPKSLESFSLLIQKLSCIAHYDDVYKMRELLFLSAIEEHIDFIKYEPTNLEAHASLANAYVMLSGLYSDPRKSSDYDDTLWIPPARFSDEMKEKFVAAAERAMEEFKILNDYAPDDPWVHAQLAYSYHDLQMPLEEIKEYETILKICPDDNETLFKLGVLYFEQGFNAKGLQVYEELKRVHYKKAESLITFYGTYIPSFEN